MHAGRHSGVAGDEGAEAVSPSAESDLASLPTDRQVFKTLRREAKDLCSRLQSIALDARFVEQVCDTYYPLPLVGTSAAYFLDYGTDW